MFSLRVVFNAVVHRLTRCGRWVLILKRQRRPRLVVFAFLCSMAWLNLATLEQGRVENAVSYCFTGGNWDGLVLVPADSLRLPVIDSRLGIVLVNQVRTESNVGFGKLIFIYFGKVKLIFSSVQV